MFSAQNTNLFDQIKNAELKKLRDAQNIAFKLGFMCGIESTWLRTPPYSNMREIQCMGILAQYIQQAKLLDDFLNFHQDEPFFKAAFDVRGYCFNQAKESLSDYLSYKNTRFEEVYRLLVICNEALTQPSQSNLDVLAASSEELVKKLGVKLGEGSCSKQTSTPFNPHKHL